MRARCGKYIQDQTLTTRVILEMTASGLGDNSQDAFSSAGRVNRAVISGSALHIFTCFCQNAGRLVLYFYWEFFSFFSSLVSRVRGLSFVRPIIIRYSSISSAHSHVIHVKPTCVVKTDGYDQRFKMNLDGRRTKRGRRRFAVL